MSLVIGTVIGPAGPSGARSGAARGDTAATSSIPPLSPDGTLFRVACPSATSCFAVGLSGTSTPFKSLVEHWNGTGWSIMTSPNPAAGSDTVLDGVACPSPESCFAVGSDFTDLGVPGAAITTLVEHWNGTSWSIMTSPNRTEHSRLATVACPSTASCFAVGVDDSSIFGQPATLVEHWNGTSWSIMTSPSPEDNSALAGVACPSATSCFAVGDYGTFTPGEVAKTLVEHWNGTSWSTIANPNPAGDSEFSSVACPTTTSCFAVGDKLSATLVEHWNGTSWSIMTSPNPAAGGEPRLAGVSCPGPTNCIAVGSYLYSPGLNPSRMLTEHWNGTSWSLMTNPDPGHSYLGGVKCPSTTSCFAVGSYNNGSADKTLVEHWNGTSWSISNPIAAHLTFNCTIRSKANGKYVTAELLQTGALHGDLRARAGTIGAWEQYQCVAIGTNQWAIKSLANNRYVTAELGSSGGLYGRLRARASAVSSWETYTFSAVPSCSCLALKAANSKFVSAELHYSGSKYALLRARSASIGAWEQFDITPG